MARTEATKTTRMTPPEASLLAAIDAEVATLSALGYSDEAIGRAASLALRFGSVEVMARQTMRSAP